MWPGRFRPADPLGMNSAVPGVANGPGSGLHYAEARYFCMYLQQRGMLETFYRQYRDGFKRNRTGITIIEKLTGQRLAELQKQWLAWVAKLHYGGPTF